MPNRFGDKSQRATDPRPARTRAAILDAIERLGARGSELTVATIVAEARLSRSSFYSQFKDLADVAVQLMGELYDEIEVRDAELRTREGPGAATRARTEMLVLELQRRSHLYAAVLGTAVSAEGLREIFALIVKGNLEAVRRIAPAGVEPEQATLYIAAGTLAVLVDWLMAGASTPVDAVLAELFSLFPSWATPA